MDAIQRPLNLIHIYLIEMQGPRSTKILQEVRQMTKSLTRMQFEGKPNDHFGTILVRDNAVDVSHAVPCSCIKLFRSFKTSRNAEVLTKELSPLRYSHMT